MTTSPSVKLANGILMPLLGLGTSTIKGSAEAEAAFESALEIGYRHFDTGYEYNNEHLLGNVLTRWLSSGKIKREELFIVTKLPPIGMRADLVSHFLSMSMKRLQLDYVDLYLVHSPVGYLYVSDNECAPKTKEGKMLLDKSTDLIAVWRAMEEQFDKGLVKTIGISNFAPSQVERIVQAARIQPVNNQVELNVHIQQKKLQETCKKYGIKICAFSPIGSPGRIEPYINRKTGEDGKFVPLIEDPVIKEMAQKHKKTTAQILLRFLTQNSIVAIPRSSNPKRMRENFEIFDFELSVDDMKQLESMDRGAAGKQFNRGYHGCEEHPEFKTDFH